MSFTDEDTTVNLHLHKGVCEMSNYNGYLLKFGGNIMPNKYVTAFSSTPNQRLETSAERDQNGNLQRATLSNYKTKISFSTRILHLNEKLEFQSILNLSMTNKIQRKCRVTYWNDETNSYHTSDFYIPDIEYTVMDAEKNDITYQPITVELIEY